MDYDPSEYNLPPDTSPAQAPSVIVPQVTHQETTANLAAGAAINFDFNVDYNPIFDMFVFATQILDVTIFVRQSTTDTYRQLGVALSGTANALIQILNNVRYPGSQVRITLTNNTGVATTALSAQVHSRSL
jgi:hypothetical protein